jgi:hypothetical protein
MSEPCGTRASGVVFTTAAYRFSASALFGRCRGALFIEERAHVLGQLSREKLDRYRLRIGAQH